MIQLGLSRITRLLRNKQPPWMVIHIAGTNGKGSVCAYASAMLHASRLRCGRFTSPHLVDRWDCITVQERPVSHSLFRHVETEVLRMNAREEIMASEFELLTAIAFEIFTLEGVEIGVVEVGLGGRHDATNIFTHPDATVITKIGLDHESVLGHTLKEIAYQKAGIMKSGVTCFVDGSNHADVLQVFRMCASQVGAKMIVVDAHQKRLSSNSAVWNYIDVCDKPEYQKMNMRLALGAVEVATEVASLPRRSSDLIGALNNIQWPGRLQKLNLTHILGKHGEVWLDGAHNEQAATVLKQFVDTRLRRLHSHVTWIFGFSAGRDIQKFLKVLLRPNDKVIAVDFSLVAGMPWVRPISPAEILDLSTQLTEGVCHEIVSGDISHAFIKAIEAAAGGPIVVTGSLYLVSDVLRDLKFSP